MSYNHHHSTDLGSVSSISNPKLRKVEPRPRLPDNTSLHTFRRSRFLHTCTERPTQDDGHVIFGRYLTCRLPSTTGNPVHEYYLSSKPGRAMHRDTNITQMNIVGQQSLAFGSDLNALEVVSKLDIVLVQKAGGVFLIRTNDFEAIEAAFNLHPATLQYGRQVMTESKFWHGKDGDKMSIILASPLSPRGIWNFISLTYSRADKLTSAIIGMNDRPDFSHDVFKRLSVMTSHWIHPLLIVILLLDEQMDQLSKAIEDNNEEIGALEENVSKFTSRRDAKSPLDQHDNITLLMDRAHTILKGSIKMLDAIQWMSRAVGLLLDVGDELSAQRQSKDAQSSSLSNFGTSQAEMKQYLQDWKSLCKSLEAGPVMVEKRCQAQIDLLYSKAAQEDNLLNFSIAISSMRESSSMKALAVITALFLPGTYIATLFAMTMFNWQGDSAASGNNQESKIVMPMFWVYWAVTAPLTILVLFSWRSWWTAQDRNFRRQLPEQFDGTLYTSTSGRRELPTRFVDDLLAIGRTKRGSVGRDGGSKPDV